MLSTTSKNSSRGLANDPHGIVGSQEQQLDAIQLSGSQVLLAADAVLAAHQNISRNLRPGGDWHRSKEHPTDQEMPLVEPYLGVFERLWIAYSTGQIDIATIEHLYGYRIRNILANPRVVEKKLQDEKLRSGWSMFIALTYALEEQKRVEEHTDDWQPPEWLAWSKQNGKLRRKSQR